MHFAERMVASSPSARFTLITAVTAGVLLAGPGRAQDTTAVRDTAPPPPPNVPRCTGERIASVTIGRAEPVVVERSAGWARPILRFLLAGEPTRESAIAPFLLFKSGGPCTELLIKETERVLRAQPYLADARIMVMPDTSGTVSVAIITVDDIRPILSFGMKGGTPTRFRFGSTNIAGYGRMAAVQWRQGFAYRDGWGAVFTDYHVFGRPLLFESVLERAPLGQVASVTFSRPLYSEVQRFAWSLAAAGVDRYQGFLRGEDEAPLNLEVERRSWQFNSVYRIGGGGFGLFGGVTVAGDRVTPADRAVIISDTGFVSEPDTTLPSRYNESSATIVGPIVGARALRFFKATGFDALEGAQDVANGVQFGGLFARQLQDGDDGWFIASALYAGVGTARSFLGVQAQAESEHAAGEWNDMIAAGRLAWYSRPSRRRTRIASLEYSGAWRSTVPLQLQLGTDRAGVRGYDDSFTAGGRRAVFRLEERLVFPGFKKYLGFGGAAYLDVGKMWAGDVPFGETVTPRVGAGMAMIFAVPRSSRRNLRVDVVAPLTPDDGAHWGVNVTITSGRPRFWREPADLARARSAARTPVVFGWP